MVIRGVTRTSIIPHYVCWEFVVARQGRCVHIRVQMWMWVLWLHPMCHCLSYLRVAVSISAFGKRCILITCLTKKTVKSSNIQVCCIILGASIPLRWWSERIQGHWLLVSVSLRLLTFRGGNEWLCVHTYIQEMFWRFHIVLQKNMVTSLLIQVLLIISGE